MIPHFEGLSREGRRALVRQLERDNGQWPEVLVEVPRAQWPPLRPGHSPIGVMRSRRVLCQVFEEAGGVVRLTFNQTWIDETTWRWADGLSWDDLQRLKREAGFGDREAVEVYPPDESVVNVGNLRHLWVLPERLPFSWKRHG